MTKLKFNCEDLEITNEMLGCTIAFSDSKAVNGQYQTVSEFLNCNETYFLLQKTFGEHDLEEDYFYIEASDENIYSDSNEKINIFLNQKNIVFTWSDKYVEIDLNINQTAFNQLNQILASHFNEKVILNIT